MEKNQEKKPPFIITAPKEQVLQIIRVISSSYPHISDYENISRLTIDANGNQIVQKLNPPQEKCNVKAGYTELLMRKVPYESDPFERYECIERFEQLQNFVKVPTPFKCPLRHKVQEKVQAKDEIHKYGRKVIMNNLSKLKISAKSKEQTEKINMLITKATNLFANRQIQPQKTSDVKFGFDKTLFTRIEEWKNKLSDIQKLQDNELEQSRQQLKKQRQLEIVKQQNRKQFLQKQKQQQASEKQKLSVISKATQSSKENNHKRKIEAPNEFKPNNFSNVNKEKKQSNHIVDLQPQIQENKKEIIILNQQKEEFKSTTPKSTQSVKQEPHNLQLIRKTSFSQQSSGQGRKSKDEKQTNTNQFIKERPKSRKMTEEERKSRFSEERKSCSIYSEERKSQGAEKQVKQSEKISQKISPRIQRVQSAKNNSNRSQIANQSEKVRSNSFNVNKKEQGKPLIIPPKAQAIQQSKNNMPTTEEQNQTPQNCMPPTEERNILVQQQLQEPSVIVTEQKKSRFRQSIKPNIQDNIIEASKQFSNNKEEQKQVDEQVQEPQVIMALVNINVQFVFKQAPKGQLSNKQQTESNNQLHLAESESTFNIQQIDQLQQRASQIISTNSLLIPIDPMNLKGSQITESQFVSQVKDPSQQESQLLFSLLQDQESIQLSESQVTVQSVVKKSRFTSKQ